MMLLTLLYDKKQVNITDQNKIYDEKNYDTKKFYEVNKIIE